MTWGILTNQAILAAPDPLAEARARAAGATYVLECRAHADQHWRQALSPDALQRRLDAGDVPTWLEQLSPPGAALEVYRLRPRTGPR
jgi:hypothetical protein